MKLIILAIKGASGRELWTPWSTSCI